MFSFALVFFALKIILQSFSIVPDFALVVYEHPNFVIGFIHLLMLGVISGFLIAFVLKTNVCERSNRFTFGVYTFVTGIVFTELVLLV